MDVDYIIKVLEKDKSFHLKMIDIYKKGLSDQETQDDKLIFKSDIKSENDETSNISMFKNAIKSENDEIFNISNIIESLKKIKKDCYVYIGDNIKLVKGSCHRVYATINNCHVIKIGEEHLELPKEDFVLLNF